MSIDDQISKQKTCAERINDAFQSRESYLTDLIYAMQSDEPFDGYDDGREAFYNYGIGASIEKKIHIKIELSWGGPADYITVVVAKCDHGYEIESADYHFADWFDHAVMSIPESSSMYEYVEEYVNLTMETGEY